MCLFACRPDVDIDDPRIHSIDLIDLSRGEDRLKSFPAEETSEIRDVTLRRPTTNDVFCDVLPLRLLLDRVLRAYSIQPRGHEARRTGENVRARISDQSSAFFQSVPRFIIHHASLRRVSGPCIDRFQRSSRFSWTATESRS